MMRKPTLDEMAAVLRNSPCSSGKVPHLTLDSAQTAAAVISSKPVKYGPPRISQPYRCQLCGMYHVGRKRWTQEMRNAAAQPITVQDTQFKRR